ncbi:MAG: DUF4294 domain-containing protein [Saprospiraceae bacterium]|nr:DUF4294 domain-containing protein [Saprospiraceae bacterium]
MRYLLFIAFVLPGLDLSGQADLPKKKMTIDGHVVQAYVDECGDTIILAELDDVSVTSMREFESRADRLKYYRYRRYAVEVYPYATEAIRIFREVEDSTSEMSKGKRRRHIRRLNRELKEQFEDPLKKLTKTQGLILTKMIERELDTPIYELIKNMRGGFTAGYWNTIGFFNGYRLKTGYIRGEDEILDAVLDDFDISYDL